MFTCIVCKNDEVKIQVDFGMQPVSNRFLYEKDTNEFKYPFQLGCCNICGLVQLVNPPNAEDMHPLYDWIVYSEPEGHLDHLVDMLEKLPGIHTDSIFCGVSHFESSTLARLNKKNYKQTIQLSLDEDFVSSNTFAVIKTIQRYLSHQNIHKLTHSHGHPDVLIVRDILEHAHQPLTFMQGLRKIVKENGYVIFEVPDYSKMFELNDFSTLWEEHISYFTPYTFRKCLEMGGFEIKHLEVYRYDMQDYFVAITQSAPVVNHLDNDSVSIESERFQKYIASYLERKTWYQSVLGKYRKNGEIALLGAGHLACHFINLFQLEELINFVVDDHPKKCGMLMPGSQLPIFPTSCLEEREIKLCLMSLNQESEKRVITNKKNYIDAGGQFASIFSTSQYALCETHI